VSERATFFWKDFRSTKKRMASQVMMATGKRKLAFKGVKRSEKKQKRSKRREEGRDHTGGFDGLTQRLTFARSGD